MLKIWRVIFVTTISLVAVLTAHSYLVLNSKTNSRALMRPGRDSLITHHAPKSRTLRMAFDIPIIPAIIGVSVGVFAIFNIENPVDLTDSGRAKAKAKRRAERLARGETIKPKEGRYFL